jgi:hypothetical protein
MNICLEKALEQCSRIILVGDVNEDQLNLNNHKFKDGLILNDINNIIRGPTRVNANSSKLIDPIVLFSRKLHPNTISIYKT